MRDVFDLRPGAIVRDLDLKRPIYRDTAAYGHFGRSLPASRGSTPPGSTTSRPPSASEPAVVAGRGHEPHVARVLPDVTGLDKQFDYLVPDGLDAPVGDAACACAARPAGRRLGRSRSTRRRQPSTSPG